MSKIQIIDATAENFKQYGRIIENHDFSELIGALNALPVTEGVTYEPSVASLESTSDYKYLTEAGYGELPIEIDYWNCSEVKQFGKGVCKV